MTVRLIMELAPGERPGTIHMHYRCFCYNSDGRSEPGKKYRCVKKSHRMYKCGATLNQVADGNYIVKGNHTHGSAPHCARIGAMKNELKIAASSSTDNPEEVFNAVSRRYSLLLLLPFVALNVFIYNH